MRIVTLILALAAVSPALAQTAPEAPPQVAPAPPAEKTQDQMQSEQGRGNLALPPTPRGRFSFAPVDEGFLRFDHDSGDVALCKPQNGSWSCDAVPGSSAARQQEIADLRAQVAALQQAVADLRAPPAPPPPPPPPVPPQTVPPSDETGSITLKQDIARARGFIEDTWRRLVDMIDNLQKDIMRKKRGDEAGLSRT